MKSLIATALFCLGVLVFATYSEPIYGNCENTIEGRTCDLLGYEWGK
jgi:hypothetical protein